MWANAIHFVKSDKPAGKVVNKDRASAVCPHYSAGHVKHEYTTGYAEAEILKFL